MVAYSPVLFFMHRRLIGNIEGREAVAKKTKFDVMIWRITGLWVGFTGFTCLFVTDLPSGFWSRRCGFSRDALKVTWAPLACLLAATHAIETWVKYQALGSRVLKGSTGNIVLGGLALAALIRS